MKKVNKGAEPNQLSNYRQNNPSNTWDQFKGSTRRKRAIQQQLRADQGGLCAYCEIDLKHGQNGSLADFRVEHFHPKSDTSGTTNWHLNWTNLLGCCHGGSSRNVVETSSRYTNPDFSCDVPKGEIDLTGIVLNPLTEVPAFPLLFSYHRHDGTISVDANACATAGVNPPQAQKTIDELHLDANRLRNLRKAALNRINQQLTTLVTNGMTHSDAREYVAKAILRKGSNGCWPPFFSAVRGYLGQAAEKHLQAINYSG